jgi:hypothetical protein
MKSKKRPVKPEPLLNTVARKLGRVAGTLTKATHELAENLSALPESVMAKARKSGKHSTKARSPQARTRHPKNKKKIRSAGKQRTKPPAGATQGKSPRSKTSSLKNQESGHRAAPNKSGRAVEKALPAFLNVPTDTGFTL